MTNREKVDALSPERREKAERCYSKGVHPLYDYIDWDAWWNSEEPNELAYLSKIKDFYDEDGTHYVFLEENVIKNGVDYLLLYCFDKDEFMYFPQTDEVYEAIEKGTIGGILIESEQLREELENED